MDYKKNKILLIQSLLLDLIGFSLIFPVVPHLLDFYVKQAEGSPMDGWLLHFAAGLRNLLPSGQSNPDQMIVLLGGILASVYSFLQFAIAPSWGRLSDRIGRRPVLVLTSIGLAMSYAIWFVSSSFTLFLISRIIGGSMAGNLGVVSASMADMTDTQNRTKAMGLLGAAFGVGFILGPVIGGAASLLDLRQFFPDAEFLNPFSFCALISVIMSAGSAFLNWRFLKETRPEHVHKQDDPASLTAGGLGGFPLVAAIAFLFTLLFAAFEFTITFFYKFQFGLDPGRMGLIFLYLGVLIVLGQGFLVRKLHARMREKAMAITGLLLIPVPLMLFGQATTVLWTLAVLVPLSAGSAFVRPSLSGLASILAPAGHQGKAMGSFRSAESLGRAIGPLAGAYLYWTTGHAAAYAVIAALIFATGLLCIRIRTR